MAEEIVPLLRSINNFQISFVRFTNCTKRPVTLYWIDYDGQAVSYGCLNPACHRDIDTFVTHPWIFVDDETKERYLVDQKDVFFPEPWLAKYLNDREPYCPHRNHRKEVLIMKPMYTLLELSSREITRWLTYKEQVFKLDIPRCLQYKLASMLPEQNYDEEDS